MNRQPEHAHLSEGDLVRYLDEEMSVDERASVAAHLLGCRACAATLDGIRAERERFSSLLAELPFEPIGAEGRAATAAKLERAAALRAATKRPDRATLLRVAAVVCLIVAAGFATSPVRAMIANLWHDVSTGIEHLAGIRTETVAPKSVTLTNASIGFVPVGDTFELQVMNEQAEGSLILGVADGASVTAQPVGPNSIDIVVLPSGLRIDNSASATADYAVKLPAHLHEVRVRIGDAPATIYRMDVLARSWVSVIPLQH